MDDPTVTQPGDDFGSDSQIQVPAFTESRRWRRRVSTRVDRGQPPPFGTAHLLLWVTMVSAYLAVARSLLGNQTTRLGGLLILLAHAALAGAAWSGLSITLSRVWYRRAFPIDPGQWLLVVVGARLALETLMRFKPGELFAAPHPVVSVCTCCLLVLPTTSRRLQPVWKLLFCALVLAHCAPLVLASLHAWLGPLLGPDVVQIATWSKLVISLILPLLLSSWMQYHSFCSTWLHWVGIAVWTLWLLLLPRVLELFR